MTTKNEEVGFEEPTQEELDNFLTWDNISEEEFNTLSVKDKRLIIAMDVLASICRKIYDTQAGRYLINGTMREFGRIPIRENRDEHCTVCALGGILVSTCKITNDLTFREVEDTFFTNAGYAKLTAIFPQDTLKFIEACFEGNSAWMSVGNRKSISWFTAEYSYSNDRLVAIMYHIISNDGEINDETLAEEIESAPKLNEVTE